MNEYAYAVPPRQEIIAVLTEISQVSMRLAMRLDALEKAKPENCKSRRGGCPYETVRGQSGYRGVTCET